MGEAEVVRDVAVEFTGEVCEDLAIFCWIVIDLQDLLNFSQIFVPLFYGIFRHFAERHFVEIDARIC